MERYNRNKKVLVRNDGKKFFASRLFPEVLPKDTDIIYITDETDFLDSLSFRYYKDPSLWWIIASVNNLGKGKLSVEGGLQIRIPTDISTIINDYNQLNT